jgi:uncharacterized protein YqgQ
MNALQREKLLFEIRNRIADLEMVVYEVMRILLILIEEKEVYVKALDLLEKLEKYEIDEVEDCEEG